MSTTLRTKLQLEAVKQLCETRRRMQTRLTLFPLAARGQIRIHASETHGHPFLKVTGQS